MAISPASCAMRGILSGPSGGGTRWDMDRPPSFPGWEVWPGVAGGTIAKCHNAKRIWGRGLLGEGTRAAVLRGVRVEAREEDGGRGGPVDRGEEEAAIVKSCDPFQILGLPEDCGIDDVKSAFRAKVKEYHPDVYEGNFDANAISQQLIKAYKALLGELEGADSQRLQNTDPFEEPEGPATCLFVNELRCIGRGCRYSCVEKARGAFKFAEETGRARASDVVDVDDYNVQLAVGQCPELCIHFVTPKQKAILERMITSVIDGFASPAEVGLELDGLLAKARYENGRERGCKRVVKKSEKYVDWF